MWKKKKENAERILTDVELELMTVIWQKGEASVADVQMALPEERKLAYTSVSTILRILEQKQFLRTRKEGRGHIYIPTIEKSAYEARSLQQLLKTVFAGEPGALIKQLLQSKDLSSSDIEQIRALLFPGEKK
jgi:predicted transcriptional regulator